MNKVITISREFGAGGQEIAKRVAALLWPMRAPAPGKRAPFASASAGTRSRPIWMPWTVRCAPEGRIQGHLC